MSNKNEFKYIPNITRWFDFLFLDYKFYPFINKEKTVQCIDECYFHDISNADLFIKEDNDDKKVFVNSLWINCVLKWCLAYKNVITNEESKAIFIKEKKLQHLLNITDATFFNHTINEFAKDLIANFVSFAKIIDNINSISFAYSLKDLDSTNFNNIPDLNDYSKQSANYKRVLTKLNAIKQPIKFNEDTKKYKMRQIDTACDYLYDFIKEATSILEQICEMAFFTLKVQTHFNFIYKQYINNFANIINKNIFDSDISSYLINTKIYQKIRQDKPNKPNILNNKDMFFDDLNLKDILKADYSYDLEQANNLFSYLYYNIKYDIYSKQEFEALFKDLEEKSLQDTHNIDFNAMPIYEDILDNVFSHLLNKDAQTLTNKIVFNSIDELKEARKNYSNNYNKNDDKKWFYTWLLNNANQNISYEDEGCIHNIDVNSQQFNFCYKLDLSNEKTRTKLVSLNMLYVALYKWRYLYWSIKCNLKDVFKNEECLPKKWKYDKDAKTNYYKEDPTQQPIRR